MADGGGPSAYLGLCPSPFARVRRARVEVGEHGTRRPGRPRRGERLRDLPQDLAFSQHLRVKTAGYTQQMPDRVLVFLVVDVGFQLVWRHVAQFRQPRDDERARIPVWVLGDCVDLQAIAGREKGRFPKAGPLKRGYRGRPVADAATRPQCLGEPLPQGHRSRTLAQSH